MLAEHHQEIQADRDRKLEAAREHRPDLAPVLAATVVGLHFLPLGKIFRQARYYFFGDRDNALVR